MSDDNIVYEITEMMRNKNGFQQDLSEAMDVVQKMFQEKYISKIQNVIQNHQLNTKQNPPKEAVLLQALKPYMNSDNHKSLDKFIDTFLMLNSIQNLKNEFASTPITAQSSEPIQDESIHEDGIYDIDAACLNKQMSLPQQNYAVNHLPKILTLMMLMSHKK